MSKFNLKNYLKASKNSGDDHIDMKLQQEHKDAPNEITEKQLKGGRVNEKEVILEKLLENKRVGGAEVIIEKNLNDSKGMFAPLRNNKAHSGNINKVEEKRLAGEKAEKEKYKPASEVPKAERWWKKLTANSSNLVKVSVNKDIIEDRMDKFTPAKGFELAREMGVGDESNEGLVPEPKGNELIGEPSDESYQEKADVNMNSDADLGDDMIVLKKTVTQAPFPAIYFKLQFDPKKYGNDENEIKNAAYDKVVQLMPMLANKINPDSFLDPKYNGVNSTIQIRLVGNEYFQSEEAEAEDLFLDFNKEEIDVGGTPTIIGRVKLSNDGIKMASENKSEFSSALAEYVSEQDSSLDEIFAEASLDFSKVSVGEITFVIGSGADLEEGEDIVVDEQDEQDEQDGQEDSFPIDDLSNENLKN